MSDFTPHAAAGAITGIISGTVSYCYGIPLEGSLMCGIASFVGSLSPDMDVKSHSSRICYTLVLVGTVLLFWNGQFLPGMALLMYSAIPQMFVHRGAWHTVLAGSVSSALLAAVLGMFTDYSTETIVAVGLSFMSGYVIHLVMDCT